MNEYAASAPLTRLQASLMVCGAAFFLAFHDAVARHLIAELPIVILIWTRYLVHLLVMSPSGWTQAGRAVLRSRCLGMHFLRAVCLLVLSGCFITGLQYIPLAEATALNFLAPLFVLVLSRMVFGETVSRLQWGAVALGLLGVMLIVRPGGGLLTPAALLPCGAAFFFSIYQLLTRVTSRTDSASTSTLWLGVFAFLLATLLLPFFWTAPKGDQWLWLIFLGLAGTGAHWLLASAYRLESPVFLAPFSYTQIVFSGLLGVLMFGTWPSSVAVVGILLIAISGLVTVLRHK
ncbi:DMT family transporter [Pseudomonas protegens]